MRTQRHFAARALYSWVLFLVLFSYPAIAQEPSVCHGTTSSGRLENGWKLPASGPNFFSYSTIGNLAGRTFVHSSVHAVVLDAYSALEQALPDTVFVYGETGRKKGGEFKPHKTHRNGLSVDFMVPVQNDSGDSVKLPTNLLNKWGYDLEFDASGRLDNLAIDFNAIAEHVYQLHVAAKARGINLQRVIFAPELQSYLHDSPRWAYLERHVQFSTRRSWVRHDEHYHVDFDVPCE